MISCYHVADPSIAIKPIRRLLGKGTAGCGNTTEINIYQINPTCICWWKRGLRKYNNRGSNFSKSEILKVRTGKCALRCFTIKIIWTGPWFPARVKLKEETLSQLILTLNYTCTQSKVNYNKDTISIFASFLYNFSIKCRVRMSFYLGNKNTNREYFLCSFFSFLY